MKGKGNSTFSTLGARITSTFSVALVLFILGIIAIMGVVAHRVTEEIKENMGFDVMLTDDSTVDDLNALTSRISASPYAFEVTAHTADEAARQWKNETGEDVEELLGVNPFAAEIEVRVKAKWANTDSLRLITADIQRLPQVEDVTLQADMIDNVNSNLSTIAFALSIVALALLIISFVLINNTVRLTVYARRFLIHTMKLVGATAAFIRRPFIVSNIIQGVIAASVAVLLVWALWSYVSQFDPLIASLVEPVQMMWIAICILGAGIVICSAAAFMAANRYIRLNYDEMFS